MSKTRRVFIFFLPPQSHLDKIIDLLIAFFPNETFENLKSQGGKKSMFHEIEVRISPVAYYVECNMAMGSPSSIGVLSIPLIGLVPCCLPGCCV